MSKKEKSIEHLDYIQSIKKEHSIISATQISLIIAALLLWELAAYFNLIDTFLTSKPSNIVKLFFHYISKGQLFHHIFISVSETIVGFLGGTIIGIIIAIGLWWSGFWAKVLDPYLVVLNSIPKTALAPIIIIWVGAGYTGIIVTAVSVLIVITIMNMYESFKSVDESKIKLLHTLGANKVQVLKSLIIPASIPDLISTLKINIGLAWVGVIVGEFLVSKAGIGYLIVYGGQVFKLDIVMMGVVVLAIISAIMYKIISIIEKKFINWQG